MARARYLSLLLASLVSHREGPVAFSVLREVDPDIQIGLEGEILPGGSHAAGIDRGPRLRNGGEDRIEIHGPDGSISASLPAESIELQHGHAGLFLSAEAWGFRYLMPTENRYMLRTARPDPH